MLTSSLQPLAMRDRAAGLIAAAERIEHYEMAAYGTVRAFALLLRDESTADLLQLTLKEEEQCDKKLTLLAQAPINELALQEACV